MTDDAVHIYVFSVPLIMSTGLLVLATYDFLSEITREKSITSRAVVSLVSMLVAQAVVFTFV